MRNESDVRARLSAIEVQLGSLREEIATLQLRVKVGDEGWRDALELLADDAKRRRNLQAEYEGLRWVLTPDLGSIAS